MLSCGVLVRDRPEKRVSALAWASSCVDQPVYLKCRIHMSVEDEAMLIPATDEIAHRLRVWLRPRCGGALPQSAVDYLTSGKTACRPFCGVTMDR